MSFIDKIREGVDRAREEATELARTTVLRLEISKLHDRKNQLLREIGQQVYSGYAEGKVVAEVETPCRQVGELEEQIHAKEAEIERLHNEGGAPPPPEEEPV